MQRHRWFTVSLLSAAFAAGIMLTGCGQAPTDLSTAGGPVATQPESPEAMQQQFAETQQRIEDQRRRQEQARQRRRSLIEVVFREIDAEGLVVVGVTNRMGKPIDDVRGGFVVEDTDGNYIASTGFTEGVPGDVFLDAGETKAHRPYGFGRKPDLLERIKTRPEDLQFFFEVRDVTYADGTKEPGLEG